MPLEVRPATLADAVKAVIIEGRAYGPNTSSIALFPGPFPDGNLARVEDLQAEREQSAACRWMKVVDTDLEAKGEDGMVAFSLWYVWEGESHLSPRKWGAGSNPEACEQFFGGMKRVWQERFQGRPHVCKFLCFLFPLSYPPRSHVKGGCVIFPVWTTLTPWCDRLLLASFQISRLFTQTQTIRGAVPVALS